ncbi:hypothetical protein KY309_00070 [Candidatus Woesearchaeota archaeon]|nr:hypothetical protein [Candidatus Woesearchaeota archaeon]MBW3015987.1 hypothetical protein [Candidatus Woesearchaeota archaeon]
MEIEFIDRAYEKVFPNKKKYEDFARVEFLTCVINGAWPYGDQLSSIEYTISLYEEQQEQCSFDYKTQNELEIMYAIREARNWYLEGGTIEEGKTRIANLVWNAELHEIFETLEDCLRVLQIHRKQKTINQEKQLIHKSLKTRRQTRTSAFHATAEYLTENSTNSETLDYLNRRIESYQNKLKLKYERAIREKDIAGFIDAYMEIRQTHDKKLQEYADRLRNASNAFEWASHEALFARQDDPK